MENSYNADAVLERAASVEVSAWRLSLDTGSVATTVPMIRGVWGKALHRLCGDSYARVFEGAGSTPRLPRYIVRAVVPRPQEQTAIEVLYFDLDAKERESMLRAWDMASGMGLGPEREPFVVTAREPLAPSPGLATGAPWTLEQAAGRIGSRDAVSIVFDQPLRIVREGKLVDAMTLPLLADAALRRLLALSTARSSEDWGLLRGLRSLRIDDGAWSGGPQDLVRYSGSQRREVELRGVVGRLELPRGTGTIISLMEVAAWLHLGKGTVFGMGRPLIRT
ncbi:MAG: CRISPR system precrRNA processing endoribonuclease RAMP protein Cas6 [Gammaproteobacteria bacterium]